MTIIYHGGCYDGFCAAFLLHEAYKDERDSLRLVPAYHNSDDPPIPPDCLGHDVIIADFTYDAATTKFLDAQARSLVVLDHHESAKELVEWLSGGQYHVDMSGAGIAWEWLRQYRPDLELTSRPHWLVQYTQDRDLWKWELPASRAVNAWMRTFPHDIEVWRQEFVGRSLWAYDADEADYMRQSYKPRGEAILKAQASIVDSHVKHAHNVSVRSPAFRGASWAWTVCNATVHVSEIAGKLSESRGIGCCWFEQADGTRVYSLRTNKRANVNVGAIAKLFGGGGHAAAAGFSVKGRKHPWEE